MDRPYPAVTVTAKAEKALKSGHPWVYGEEITSAGDYENGGLVDVFSGKGRYMGTGYVNDHSKIRVRIISRNANDRFDEEFYERRIRYAVDYRRTVMGKDFDCCRLIFGEADCFPGLTVDRFGDVLSVQTACLGIDLRKDMLFRLLLKVLAEYGVTISSIYERNESAIRAREGLAQYKGFYTANGLTDGSGHVLITENGIKYDVDYRNGQKTGFFLDQKYNRVAAARIASGKRVLDCFTHTGAFALNAAAGGASFVDAVDVSPDALKTAETNAKLNGITNVNFICADVFDFLTDLHKTPYDMIILDPPAFTKSSSTVANAVRGYKEINVKAMRLLPRGGYLATCSCSHFMTDELFRKMLRDAAYDAGVQLRQIAARTQSPDHPILWNVPETDYLKFYIFQVV